MKHASKISRPRLALDFAPPQTLWQWLAQFFGLKQF